MNFQASLRLDQIGKNKPITIDDLHLSKFPTIKLISKIFGMEIV